MTTRTYAPDGERFGPGSLDKAIGRTFAGPTGLATILSVEIVDEGKAADVTLECHIDPVLLADLLGPEQAVLLDAAHDTPSDGPAS